MKNFLKICTIIIFSTAIFLLGILKVNALDLTGNSGRVYKNLNSDKVVIYIGTGSNTITNATYSQYRVSYYNNDFIGFYIPIQNQYNAFIYPYTNLTEISQDRTNYNFSRYNIANSGFSSYNSLTSVNYLNVGTGFGRDFLSGTKNIYDYIDYSYSDIVDGNNNILYCGNIETSCKNIDTAFEQGEVIIANSSGTIANLITYYLEPNFDDFNINDYKFSYIENSGGGARESVAFNLTYNENGITYNNKIYHYYFNLPLSYNTDLTFSIKDLENNLIKRDYFSAYLSSLSSLSNYNMYDFRNYEYANMSDINSGSFGVSRELNSNITINAINYNTNVKIDFFTSTYYVSSTTDSAGITWYDFNFNNEPIYLEIINNFNDNPNFYTLINAYDLYLYFDNTAYIHLSGSPNSLDSQDNIVNQQSYKNANGDIIYNNNPIIFDANNSNAFFNNLQKYFKDFDNDNFGLTGIITSPLYLIQNLSSNTCSSLSLPIPYTNKYLSLPCMYTIYQDYFGVLFTIYQDITFGVVAYWVLVRILNLVKDFRNPQHDEIEVLDL